MNDFADHGTRFGRIAPVLPVQEMARAEWFYTRILGFRKTFETGVPISFMILERDSGELHLSLQPERRRPSGFPIAHLMVDEIEAFHAACLARGVPVRQRLEDDAGRLSAFVIEDPDGNRIDIGRSS